ncbi:MAG: hypothetical protein CVT67_03605 [Actinobacteria bacterium HGW-Actinobacteria-7]|jgi:hypothetical protein|nr:MAG: hypothetical protein CVT67_03605 [Actinobacteria bacterium HGW-Actinobacteria-7]
MDNPNGPVGPTPAPPIPPVPTSQYGGPTSGAPEGQRIGRGGANAGIVLILLGAVLLSAQFLPGIRIWMLWPLFIVVPGLVQCFTGDNDGWSVHRFFDGLVTVTVGLIFLGNTTGYVSWGVWWQILQLWPVLLISAGFGILGKATGQEWLRVMGTVAVLFAFAYAVTTASTGSAVRFLGTPGGQPFAFQEPSGGVQRADLKLSAGVGEVTIGPGSDLISIEGESPFSAPRFASTVSGSSATMDFDLTSGKNFTVYPGGTSARVDAKLSRAVAWNIEVDSGVSSLNADLSTLRVESLKLKTGVSSNRVVLGEVPVGVAEATMNIDTGVSSVKVLVPYESQVRIESSSGLTGHDIASGLESQGGGVWQTPGYDQAVHARSGVWIISVKSGVGSVTVDTY